jgi:hypothetical protein
MLTIAPQNSPPLRDSDGAAVRRDRLPASLQVEAATPVLRRKELAAFGEYQSKRKALEEYERFAE